MSLMLWPCAIAIGLALGLFGAGGGMVTIPALVFFTDLSLKEAITASLWIVAMVSATALLYQRCRWYHLNLRLLGTFGGSGALGSVLGTALSVWIPEGLQMAGFALLILLVTCWTSWVKLEDQISVFRWLPAALAGVLIGVMTGIFGVGGGFLLVPALLFLGIGVFDMAVLHSLVLVLSNALVGAVSASFLHPVEPMLVIEVGMVASVGSIVGSMLLRRWSSGLLQRVFSGFLLVLGGLMLWRALG